MVVRTVVIAFSVSKNIAIHYKLRYNNSMIKTERLEIVPLNKKLYKSLLKEGKYEHLEMVEPFKKEVIEAIEEDFKKFKNRDYLMIWSIWLVVKDHQIIGNAGFKNLPYDTVDIAYEIFQPFRRNGYCLEVVRGLIEFARNKSVETIRADCDQDNIASSNLLVKLGFECINIENHRKHYVRKI